MSMTNEMMPKSHLLDLRHPRLVVKINNCLVFNFTVYEIETNEEPISPPPVWAPNRIYNLKMGKLGK